MRLQAGVRSLLVSLAAAMAAAVSPAGAAAASEPGMASLSGSIVSTSGLALPGALVTLVHAESGGTRTVTAVGRGLWRTGPLEAGSWTVTAEARGFLPASASLRLAAGEEKSLDLALPPSPFEESLTVTSSAPRDSLEAAAIRESASRDAGEALGAMPGVWSLRKGGIANEVILRGFQAADTSLLIDGQRVYGACPNHMDPPAFHVDFSEVDRIEVGKGPFDVRTQGSLGGAVNVVTRRPDPGFHAAPTFSAGSWGYVNPAATVSWGGDKVSVLGGYSYRASKPYEDGSGEPFTEVAGYLPGISDEDAYQVQTGWARASLTPRPGHAVQASWSRQQADDVLYPYLLMDALYDDTDRIGLGYEYDGGGALKALSVQTYATFVDHWMTDEFRTSSGTAPRGYSMGSKAETRTGGGRIEARFARATVGLEAYARSWDVVTELAGMKYAPQNSLPDVTVSTAGLYAETEAPLGGTWTLRAGARIDGASMEADAELAPTDLYAAYQGTRSTSADDAWPSANVRLLSQTPGGFEFAAGIGHTSRLPEPNERFFGLRRKGTDWVGNPDLVPSRNTGIDVSLALRRTGLYAGLNLFASSIDDNITVHGQPRIHSVPGVMNATSRSYVNNDARRWGAELGAAVSLTQRLSLSGDYSFVRATQEENESEGITSTDVAETPPARLRAALRFSAAHAWGEGETVVSADQDHVDTDLLEEPTSGWAILNLKGGLHHKRTTIVLGLNNVFDRRYSQHLSYQRDPYRSGTRVYEPGRSLFANVALNF